MLKISIVCFIALLLAGCQDSSYAPSASAPEKFRQGTYTGLYIRTRGGSTDTGKVEFTFNGTIYTCTPISHAPMLYGEGHYTIDSSTIDLRDYLARPAIYTPEVIIFGEFSYEVAGHRLVMTQELKLGQPPNQSIMIRRFELAGRH
jgi:hypothetical protein